MLLRRLVTFVTASLVLRIPHPRWRFLDLDVARGAWLLSGAAPFGLCRLLRAPCTSVASLSLLLARRHDFGQHLGFLLSGALRLVAFGTALLVLRIAPPVAFFLDLDVALDLAALWRRPLRFVPPTSRVCTPVASLSLLSSRPAGVTSANTSASCWWRSSSGGLRHRPLGA